MSLATYFQNEWTEYSAGKNCRKVVSLIYLNLIKKINKINWALNILPCVYTLYIAQ